MKRITALPWILILLVILAACEEKAAKITPDLVTVQLKWVHQAQFAGMYVAREKGYYAKENLEVEFIEGGPGIDSAASLLTGKARFSVLTPEDVLIGRGKGKPFKAIAVIYQRNSIVFLTREESNILRPRDFEGKTVASGGEGSTARNFRLQLDAMVMKLGLDISKIKIVPYDPTYKAFLEGGVDISPASATGGLISLRRQGARLHPIWPSDYGIHSCSDTIVCTDQTIQDNPNLVTRFLRATLHGWRDAIQDGDMAVTSILKYAQVKDKPLQTEMMEAILPLVHTGEDHVGWMKPEVWQGIYGILLSDQFVEDTLDPAQAYTTEFLNAIYGGGPK